MVAFVQFLSFHARYSAADSVRAIRWSERVALDEGVEVVLRRRLLVETYGCVLI